MRASTPSCSRSTSSTRASTRRRTATRSPRVAAPRRSSRTSRPRTSSAARWTWRESSTCLRPRWRRCGSRSATSRSCRPVQRRGRGLLQGAQARTEQPAAPAQGGNHPRAIRPLLGCAALVQPRPAGCRGAASREASGCRCARALPRLRGVKLRQGEFQDCIEWCQRSSRGGQAAGPARARARLLPAAPRPHARCGAPSAHAFRGLALPIYEELGDLLGQANVLNNLGIDAYYEGRWQEALDLYERSRRRASGSATSSARPRSRTTSARSSPTRATSPPLPSSSRRRAGVFETAGHRMLLTHAPPRISAGSPPRGRAARRRARRALQQALRRRGDQRGRARRRDEGAAGRAGGVRRRSRTGASRGRRGRCGRPRRRAGGPCARSCNGSAATRSRSPADLDAPPARPCEQSLETARAAEETNEAALTLESDRAPATRAARTARARSRGIERRCSRDSASSRPRTCRS